MGTFRVRLDVGDAGRERFEPVDALVDTGASYTVLEELRLAPDPVSKRLLPVPARLMLATS